MSQLIKNFQSIKLAKNKNFKPSLHLIENESNLPSIMNVKFQFQIGVVIFLIQI
jgi:hypothetical protein